MQPLSHSHADCIYLSQIQNRRMDAIDTIGKRIRLRRRALKMSQDALAGSIGIKQPSLCDIENGHTKEVSAKVLGDLCRALTMAWEYALFGAGPEQDNAAEQSELLATYRALLPAGRAALLHSARTLREAQRQAEAASRPAERYERLQPDAAATLWNQSTEKAARPKSTPKRKTHRQKPL